MKYLIIGRSGSGKDTMAKELTDRGLSIIKTYTTRPPRTENDTQHYYLTEEEADALPDHFAEITIHGYRYFMTKELLEKTNPDIIIIEPVGARELVEHFPETAFQIIHMIANDPDERRQKAIDRADDPEKEAAIYDAKIKDEDLLFTPFEDNLKNGKPFAENVMAIFHVKNDYQIETLKKYANNLIGNKHLFNNVSEIINQCLTRGILLSTKKGFIDTYALDETTGEAGPISVPYECFVNATIAYPDAFNILMSEWLSAPLDISQKQKNEKDIEKVLAKIKAIKNTQNFREDLIQAFDNYAYDGCTDVITDPPDLGILTRDDNSFYIFVNKNDAPEIGVTFDQTGKEFSVIEAWISRD